MIPFIAHVEKHGTDYLLSYRWICGKEFRGDDMRIRNCPDDKVTQLISDWLKATSEELLYGQEGN
jgi:hypothetical protein